MPKISSQIKVNKQKFQELKKTVKDVSSATKAIEAVVQKETTQVFDAILASAILLNASDIHIEPEEEKAKLRMRVDGVLHKIDWFNKKTYNSLLSRIKLVSGMKLNVTKIAQDGRFSFIIEEKEMEMRVSTLPSEYGETVVMRILNPENLIEIEQLGIREDMVDVFKKQISQPNGMIVVTGPTGSGKTTTLYAILKRIKRPEIKIITIEDPVEYRLEGISQSQVNPKRGYDFANGLRAIVRQDPDVILVGEIRDYETAHIALQAAMTGHLVLTTLHTNNAAGTITRLQALGEKPVNIAPALNLAIAQRLVRKVCKKCVEFDKPTDQEFNVLKKELSSLPKNIKVPKIDKNLRIPRAKGCKACNYTGYKGRLGIYEFFLVDDEMENFILKSPSIPEMTKKAEEKGMVPMRKDGLIKAALGLTTIDEVNRVTGE
ncbi:type II/IV secretion system protein [bacterium]|nr:type II/IV secretion system protein [bacterium]